MKLAVYIVEDDPSIQDSLKVVIEAYLRAEVMGWAPSEAEALAWLRANDGRWHLLVVDLTLAQGSGLGVLAAVSQMRNGKGVVVALTNAASPGNRATCLRLGADAVFDKSEEINQFLAYCEKTIPGAEA
ncbi:MULTISPECIES: response regulator [unclassified Variovorax]|uniref:response regulator n=1 Tax=unclassified Variovorax TaxID=663243 RepID=UPI003F45D023